jgi:hypothetical protein
MEHLRNENQLDALFIFHSVKPLHVSGIFIAHHQEVFTAYVQQLARAIHLSRLAAGRVRMEHFLNDTNGVKLSTSGITCPRALYQPQVKRQLAWNRFSALVTRTREPNARTLAERTSSRTSTPVTFQRRRLYGDQTTYRKMDETHSTHGRETCMKI